MLTVLVLVVVGYLLGSIPTAVLVGRLVGGIDIRERGSGNAGASNILRTLGIAPALLVLAVDVAKGFAAAELGRRLRLDALPVADEWAPIVASLAAIGGHLWPLFARFRGGKGVATAAGVLLALDPALLVVGFVVFATVVAATRRIAPGSILAAVSLPVTLLVLQWLGDRPATAAWMGFNLLLALLLVYTHRANLGRLLRGSEPRLGG